MLKYFCEILTCYNECWNPATQIQTKYLLMKTSLSCFAKVFAPGELALYTNHTA